MKRQLHDRELSSSLISIGDAVFAYDVQGNFTLMNPSVQNLIDRENTYVVGLMAYQEKLRSLASHLFLTEECQRRKIAEELHEGIAQLMAASCLKLGMLRSSASDDLVAPIDEIIDLIERTIDDARSLTYELSPPVLYSLGFQEALEWLMEETQKSHDIKVLLDDDGQDKPLKNDVKVILFRAVRELLENVIKHARASQIKVTLARVKQKIQVCVEDDGTGFDVSKACANEYKDKAFGLFNIQERLAYIGGRVDINSNPNQGSKIILIAPLSVT